jgi:hypothetical protein
VSACACLARFIHQPPPVLSTEPYITKSPHPFDTPRRLTMHRFLGYNYSGVTHNLVNFLMDLGLLVCFVLLLKPLALATIYLELILRLLYGTVALIFCKILRVFARPILQLFSVFPADRTPGAVQYFQAILRDVLEAKHTTAAGLSDKLLCIFRYVQYGDECREAPWKWQ